MITIYGIKNCDTMQKAFKWLDAKQIKYTFHNYKEAGIDKATLAYWLKHIPADKLINTKSTTYRELPDTEKDCIASNTKAIKVMMNNPSIIKRPLWDFGNDHFLLGWNEKELSELL